MNEFPRDDNEYYRSNEALLWEVAGSIGRLAMDEVSLRAHRYSDKQRVTLDTPLTIDEALQIYHNRGETASRREAAALAQEYNTAASEDAQTDIEFGQRVVALRYPVAEPDLAVWQHNYCHQSEVSFAVTLTNLHYLSSLLSVDMYTMHQTHDRLLKTARIITFNGRIGLAASFLKEDADLVHVQTEPPKEELEALRDILTNN